MYSKSNPELRTQGGFSRLSQQHKPKGSNTLTNNVLESLSTEQLKLIKERIRSTKINVLLVGGTGVGKSSTINALFQNEGKDGDTAAVGDSTRPETMGITKYELNENLTIWDSPGLGDSPEKDTEHSRKIIEALHQKDAHGKPLIDLVFLILDASSRDFGSAYTLIADVITPNLHDDDLDRLLIGLNQADQAMKGHYWNKIENKPEEKLLERLDELALSVKDRIKESTGLDVEPIYYSAGCVIEGERLSEPYNLTKLLSFVLDHLPKKKRAVIAEHINQDKANFRHNDDKDDYQQRVDTSILSSFLGWTKEVAADIGDKIKDILTDPDNIKMAATVAVGFIKSLLKK
ncbi:GTPase family protein [Stutzerimonas nitrititolerans]|uniref:GTPase family protein n=1 Tax=Stutzerimonas nitrititolerans TaxID=2482751 RepID=UPI0028AD4F15|nr:GTPase [Stutzerimonas nitrititolerans]